MDTFVIFHSTKKKIIGNQMQAKAM